MYYPPFTSRSQGGFQQFKIQYYKQLKQIAIMGLSSRDTLYSLFLYYANPALDKLVQQECTIGAHCTLKHSETATYADFT